MSETSPIMQTYAYCLLHPEEYIWSAEGKRQSKKSEKVIPCTGGNYVEKMHEMSGILMS